MTTVDFGIGKILSLVKTHEAGILDLDDRLKKIEQKKKDIDDIMVR